LALALGEAEVVMNGMAYAATQRAQRSARQNVWLITGGSLVASVFVVLALWAVNRDMAARDRQQESLALALEASQENNRGRTRFFADMSHELRSPLNSILGFAEMLQDGLAGDMNAEQDDMVKTIDRNGRHLLTLINDILDRAKAETTNLTIRAERLSMAALAEDVAASLKPLADKKGLTVTVDAAAKPLTA
jgi:signal transduction histidine kinase